MSQEDLYQDYNDPVSDEIDDADLGDDPEVEVSDVEKEEARSNDTQSNDQNADSDQDSDNEDDKDDEDKSQEQLDHDILDEKNDQKNQRPSDKRITPPFITKYEKARIIGTRALQISKNSPIYIDAGQEDFDPIAIAEKEFAEGKIPFIIRRYLPDKSYEDWPLSDLTKLD